MKRTPTTPATLFLALLLLVTSLPSHIQAQTPERTVTSSLKNSLQTKRIAVFKNNSAFYIKSGRVPTTNGKFIVNDSLPQALFGTLWFNSPDNKLASVSSYADTISRKTDALSINEMLKGNIGKSATLYIKKGEKEEEQINGKITAFNGQVLTIQTGTSWSSIDASTVSRVDFASNPNLQYPIEQRSRVLELSFENNKTTQNLDMMYLQNGLGWVPNYQVELLGDDKARLSLRALLVNDSEDIKGAEIQFVVGVPSFMYADRVSPLVDAQNMGRLLSGLSASGTIDANMFSNSHASQTISYESDTRSNFSAGAALGGLDGSQTEDLFFYKTSNVTLPKSGRAFYDLFRAEVPIEHVYEGQIRKNNAQNGYYGTSHQFSGLDQMVTHKIKLTNNTTYPWTTGTALATSTEGGELRPLSQDRLLYTAVGGESYLKLTEAPQVQVLHSEIEVARDVRKMSRNKVHYDLVTIEGEIKIKNYKDKAINLNMRRTITGELLKSNQSWLTARNAINASPNSVTDVCWELKLGSGDEKVVKYSYKVYVR